MFHLISFEYSSLWISEAVEKLADVRQEKACWQGAAQWRVTGRPPVVGVGGAFECGWQQLLQGQER